jgi:hypothetical protein
LVSIGISEAVAVRKEWRWGERHVFFEWRNLFPSFFWITTSTSAKDENLRSYHSTKILSEDSNPRTINVKRYKASSTDLVHAFKSGPPLREECNDFEGSRS